MKLYIKEKVFSWGDKFTVKDAYGEDKYIVEGELFTFGKKLHVYDRSGREVAFIKLPSISQPSPSMVYLGNRKVNSFLISAIFRSPQNT